MSVIAYKVVQGMGDKLTEGEILHIEEADAQPLVDAGILAPASDDEVNGGEDVEQVDDVGAVSNAAKALSDKVTEAVEKATKAVAEKMAKTVPAPVIKVPAATVDHKYGFSNLGDFCKCVIAGQSGNLGAARRIDSFSKAFGRSKASTGTGGGPSVTASDGGVLIPPAYAQSLFEKVKNVTDLWDHCTDYPFANTTELPVDNETGFNSGVKAYWQTEDAAVTATNPVLSKVELKAQTLLCTVPVTQQLLTDNAYALDTWLGRKVPTKIVDQKNLNLLYGAGSGANVFGNAATIVVTRGTTGRITYPDIISMYARMHQDNLDGAKWYVSPSYYTELLKLSFPDSTGTYPIYVPTPGGFPNVSGAVAGSLLGKPVVLTHTMQALGYKGDILFADLGAVAKVENQLDAAVSIHFYFDRYSNLFRFALRGNTASQWLTTYTRMDGVTASPFVVLSGTSTVMPTIS